jgi:putative FmdB family regulatory protein
MPIYEYVCEKCGKVNDVLQKINDPAPNTCNGCGAENSLTKIVSRSSFVLRGGGWYADLYSSAKKDTGTGSSEGKTQDTASKSSEPAPASSAPAKTPAPKSDSTAPKDSSATKDSAATKE